MIVLKMLKKIIVVCFMLIISLEANASTWQFLYTFSHSEFAIFFDSDSVERNGDNRLIWYKFVRKNAPDSDGAWASASKYKINCRDKSYVVLHTSDYNKDNIFIKSYPGSPVVNFPVPDSAAETIVKISCRANFPHESSNNAPYGKINGNDIFDFTKFLKEWESTRGDKVPI